MQSGTRTALRVSYVTMGINFLLAALPYLAVLAVPAVIAAVLRRRKKNG